MAHDDHAWLGRPIHMSDEVEDEVMWYGFVIHLDPTYIIARSTRRPYSTYVDRLEAIQWHWCDHSYDGQCDHPCDGNT